MRSLNRKESLVLAAAGCAVAAATLVWPWWNGQLQWLTQVERLYRDFDHQQSMECESIMGKMLETAHAVGKTQEFGDWLENEAEVRRQAIVVELAHKPASVKDKEYLDRRIRRLEHLYITLMVVRRQSGPDGLIVPLCGMAAVDNMRNERKLAKQHLELASALAKEEIEGSPQVRVRAVSFLDRTYY